jgi:hypothetical protein
VVTVLRTEETVVLSLRSTLGDIEVGSGLLILLRLPDGVLIRRKILLFNGSAFLTRGNAEFLQYLCSYF